jgi:hypothetical protein
MTEYLLKYIFLYSMGIPYRIAIGTFTLIKRLVQSTVEVDEIRNVVFVNGFLAFNNDELLSTKYWVDYLGS